MLGAARRKKRNARAFHQAPQDAHTGQPKLTRIEVRHWDSNAGLFKIIHKSCHAEHDNLCFWETLEE